MQMFDTCDLLVVNSLSTGAKQKKKKKKKLRHLDLENRYGIASLPRVPRH